VKLDELAAKQVINDEVIDHFDEDFYGDFYDFFVNFMKFKELTGQMKKNPDEAEFVFYLKNDDDHYGYKLVFDHDLRFLPEESDISAAVLGAESVEDFEKSRDAVIEEFARKFSAENQHDLIQNFNVEIGKLFDQYDWVRIILAMC
jgi:hypothetical protein